MKNSLLIFIISIISASFIQAQSLVEKRANKLFSQYAYASALPLYERVIKKEPNNKAVTAKLAETYRRLNRPADAVKWYSKMMEEPNVAVEDYLHYAQALTYVGNKEHAKKWFEKYQQARSTDARAARYLDALEKPEQFYKDADAYKVSRVTFNTPASDFGAQYLPNNGLIYTSSGNNKSHDKSIYKWDGKAFLDIFEVKFNGNDSTFGEPKRLGKRINSKYHDGPAAISPDGQWLAFTRNNFKNGVSKRSFDKVNKLKLFICRKEGNSWSKPTEYLYNSNQYSCGHPAFSADSKSLYFASDMSGGFGGSDIYKARLENGIWTKAENLGAKVNTEGNEFFPYLVKDSVMYFSSNGWGGLGGLDVMMIELNGNDFKTAENVGYPINTQFDDFAMIYNPATKSGFFSSNRDGGKGLDDIYRFTYKPNPVSLVLIDKRTQTILKGVKVKATDGANETYEGITDNEGKLKLPLKVNKAYQISTKFEGYNDHFESVTVPAEINPGAPIKIMMQQPAVLVEVFDKFKNKPITGAALTLFDKANLDLAIEEIRLDEKSEFRFVLKPCTEYKVIAKKTGLPDAEQTFKSACTEANEATVRLLTGVAPPKGIPLTIKVIDEQNNEPVANAKVNMFNKGTQELIPMLTDENGVFETVLAENVIVGLGAYRVGYFSTSKSKAEVKTSKGDKPITKELKLLKLREGGIIALEGIFYDLAKSNIRPDAAKVLDYVVQVMEENPGLVIELGSHTDARGSDADNLKLSDARAKSAADYIISKGIASSRITGKGYGETVLKNKCGNGVKCDDKLHQENRRTEIKILDF